jgi:hypothetical protein
MEAKYEDGSLSSEENIENNRTQVNRLNTDLNDGPKVIKHLNQVTQNDISENNYRKNPKLLNEPSVRSQLLSAIPPRLRKENDFQRTKSNSTSSLFVDFTIENPLVPEIVKCLASALYHNIKQAENKGQPIPGPITTIFSEDRFPLNNDVDLTESPSLDSIKYFLSLIFNRENLSAECGVMALAYIDRLLSLTSLHLHASNWRRITLGALILASKVWEDLAVWNADFLQVFPNISVDDLNRLERQFLNAIQYMVTLKSSVYTKYFLELSTLSEKKIT